MRFTVPLLLILTLTCASRAAIPGAEDPKAYTEHDYLRAKLAFNRRTSVDAYNVIGKRNPKWDEQAAALLDGWSRHLTYGQAHAMYRLDQGIKPEAFHALAKAARETGCDDPLVNYVCLVAENEQGRPEAELQPALRGARDELSTSKYPINRAWASARRYWISLPAEDPGQEAAWEQYKNLAIAVLSLWEFKDVDRRILYEFVVGNDDGRMTTPLMDALLAEPKVDPWVMHLLQGRRAIDDAWRARGSGFAHTVGEEGWAKFHQHLDKARDHFTAAHELEPKLPQPAVQMITVEMGSGGAEMRLWFDRALAAQIDFTPAYDNYLYALLPRWHGTHDMMYRVGVECLETKRFDTRVPWQLMNAMQRIVADDEDPQFWQRPGVYEQMKEMLEGYAAAPGEVPAKTRDWYRSLHAAIAWRTHRFQDSVALMDGLGERFQPHAFHELRVMRDVAISHAYAMSDAGVATLAQTAERQAATPNGIAAAIQTYDAALRKLDPTHKGQVFVKGRLKQLEWRRQFDAGEWVDIQPGKDLAGWATLEGTWEVDNLGDLVGTFDKDGLVLQCQVPSWGRNFILEGAVDMGDQRCAAGVTISPQGPTRYYGIYAWQDKAKGESTVLRDFNNGVHQRPVELKPVNEFTIEAHEGVVGVKMNDDVSRAGLWMFDRPKVYIGVGGRWGAPGTKVRFRSLRIKQWDGKS